MMPDDINNKKIQTGTLYLAPSPLGNLGDLTLRVIRILKEADLVCAEDTRRALKLLNHLDLRKTLLSYREQNHQRAWPKIASVLAEGGQVVLMTDAGAPAVSDPGAALAVAARASGFDVLPLPGPSAVITALMASGFSADRFTFAGFMPSRTGERREFLQSFQAHRWTMVFFETPHRLTESLGDLADIMGPRPAVLAREMTKLHEEYLALDLVSLAADVRANPRKGEITIVVEGFNGEEERLELNMDDLRDLAMNDERPVKVLAAELAGKYGRGRSEMYQLLLAARRELP